MLGPHVHIEPARGSMQQNIDYCTKEDTRTEEEDSGPHFFGAYTDEDLSATQHTIARGGTKHSSLDQWGERAKHSGGLIDIANCAPGVFVRHHRGLIAIRALYIQPRDPQDGPRVSVYTGPSGSGKTRAVYSHHSHSEVYSKDGSTKWWDGYDAQPVVLIDDFTGSRELPPTLLLRILDRYPLTVQTKGGHIPLARAHFILTSSIHHHSWYRGEEDWREQIQAFERRVTEWRVFPEGILAQPPLSYTSHPIVERDPYTGQLYTTY